MKRQKDMVMIEPSKEFRGRVMQDVLRRERHRGLWHACLLGLAIMMPVIVRAIWISVRNDYFSIEHWPLGHIIISIYQVVLSPVAGYVILSLGTAGSAYIIWRGFHKIQGQVSRIGMA
jgi:hypothetical protein